MTWKVAAVGLAALAPLVAPTVAQDTGSIFLEAPTFFAANRAATVAGGESFLVVWNDEQPLLARQVGSKGERTGSNTVLVEPYVRFYPFDFEATAAGPDFVVGWHDNYFNEFQFFGPQGEIFTRRLEGGAAPGPALSISGISLDNDRLSGLQGRNDGSFAVGYSSSPNDSYYRSGQRGSVRRGIRSYSPTDQQTSSSFESKGIFSMSRAGEGFAVVEAGLYEIPTAQRLTETLDDDGPRVTVEPARALLESPGEGFLVVWQDGFADTLTAQRRSEDFGVDGAGVEIASGTDIRQVDGFEAIDGGFLIVWRDSPVAGEVTRWRYLRPDGVLEPAFEFTGDGGEPLDDLTEVAVDREGRFIVSFGEWIRAGQFDRTVVVDGFGVDQAALTVSTVQPGATATGLAVGLDMAGGERDVELELVGGNLGGASVEVADGQLTFAQTGDASARATLVWDQVDGDAVAVDDDGLRALDLTSGGTRDALAVDLASADAGARLVFDVISAAGTSSFTLSLPAGSAAETYVIPFEDFTGGADLTRAGALRLAIDGG
ncbi:MAG: hypothetical protein AAFY88_15455, partial [Acidobacteriota bacterium]